MLIVHIRHVIENFNHEFGVDNFIETIWLKAGEKKSLCHNKWCVLGIFVQISESLWYCAKSDSLIKSFLCIVKTLWNGSQNYLLYEVLSRFEITGKLYFSVKFLVTLFKMFNLRYFFFRLIYVLFLVHL